MKIKEVEARVGMTRANIRYYEKEGLLNTTVRNENNYREYTEEDIEGHIYDYYEYYGVKRSDFY